MQDMQLVNSKYQHPETCFANWSAKQIAARNYNLDRKNPHEVTVNHGDPET